MVLGASLLAILQAVADPIVWKERNQPDMPRLSRCEFRERASEASSFGALPRQVAAELARFFGPAGGLADAGGAFNSTDVVEDRGVPQRRFVRAYLVRDVWLIWYEHGGIGHHLHTLALTKARDGASGATVFRATPGSNFTGDLCAGSRAFLAGARTGSDM